MIEHFTFGIGLVAGAAIFGHRRWAMWIMAGLAAVLALGNVVQGDWLWVALLGGSAWVWAADASTVRS